MKLKNFTKKKAAAAGLAFGVAAGAGGIAAAYFLATGTGTGQATVGHATPFTITQRAPAGELYPGQHQFVAFTILNSGGGIQHWNITATQIMVATTGGNIVTAKSGSAVPGCLASWFSGSPYGTTSGTLNPGAKTVFTVKVTMSNGTSGGSPQNACETKFPALSVAFTGPVHGFALFGQFGGSATWTNTHTAAVLSVPSTKAGEAAGITVLHPGTTLPATAPKMTATTYAAGTPRWVILFATGAHVFGYPTNATGVGGKWGTGLGIGSSYTTWNTVKTDATGKNVSAVFIVMDTSHGAPASSTVTNVTYGGNSF